MRKELREFAMDKDTKGGRVNGFMDSDLYTLDRYELERLVKELDYALYQQTDVKGYNDGIESAIKEYTEFYPIEEEEN